MEHVEYKQLSERTLSDLFFVDDPVTRNLLHGSIGIVTEMGELNDAMKKEDVVNVGEELADIMWYVSIFDRHFGIERPELSVPMSVDDEFFKAAADLMNVFKAKIFYDRPWEDSKIINLVNFIQANIDSLCTHYELDISKLRAQNIEKLQARFPDKFTTHAANNRNLEVERAILES